MDEGLFSMDTKDLIKAGRLSEARAQLTEEVKAKPGDSGRRTLLFQVLAFCGEWDKAERHLDAIGSQDVAADIGVQVYRNLVCAERERMEVSKLKRRPSFLPETPSYLETYYAAWAKLGEQKIEEAKALFDQIDAQRPIVSGTVNGKSFTGFKDTDTFLSIFLEGIVHERYVWIPFEAIRELVVSAPKALFDLLWTTARITTWEGLTMNCYLPVLYPDSFLHEEDRVKLGRMTDWIPLGGPFAKGSGQHVFQIGKEEMGILEIREALFNPQD
jgi:type VI secretion system protein ImpE